MRSVLVFLFLFYTVFVGWTNSLLRSKCEVLSHGGLVFLDHSWVRRDDVTGEQDISIGDICGTVPKSVTVSLAGQRAVL